MKHLLVASLLVIGSRAWAADLPVPPVPPDDPALGEAAPMPNVNASAPVTPDSDRPRVDVRLYRAKSYYDTSAGFAPGSRYQDSEERKAIQTPGFSINVPLK